MSQTESDCELEPMRTLLCALPAWVGPSKRPAYLEVCKRGRLINIFSLDTAPIVSLGRSADKVLAWPLPDCSLKYNQEPTSHMDTREHLHGLLSMPRTCSVQVQAPCMHAFIHSRRSPDFCVCRSLYAWTTRQYRGCMH